MKLGVVGKGGVGKTTISGLLARSYAARGQRVVAIDTDSNPNLGLSLGLSMAESEAVPPLPRSAMVGSRGTPGDAPGGGELLAAYGRPTRAGPTLLSAIKVSQAGAGCTCSGHATVRNMLADTLDGVDVTLVDMEAGLEHLSRSGGTLAYADVLLAVCEPTRKSVMTAARTAALAAELGIPHVVAVGNKARSPEDESFLTSAAADAGLALLGVLPYETGVAAAERSETVDLVSISATAQAVLDDIITGVDAALRGLVPRAAPPRSPTR